MRINKLLCACLAALLLIACGASALAKVPSPSKEFYYLGEMRPTGRFVPIVMAGTDAPAVEIEYDLLTPVADELYDYLTSGT